MKWIVLLALVFSFPASGKGRELCDKPADFTDSDGTPWKAQTLGRKKLGQLQGVDLFTMEFTMTEQETEEEHYFHCLAIELVKGEKKKLVPMDTAEDDEHTPPGGHDRLADFAIENGKLVSRLTVDSKWEDADAEQITPYFLNPATLTLKAGKTITTSSAQRQQEKLSRLIREGKLREAAKEIQRLDTNPSGNFDLQLDFFEDYTVAYLKQAQKQAKSPAALAELLDPMVDAWINLGAEEYPKDKSTKVAEALNGIAWYEGKNTNREGFTKPVEIWNNLAFYFYKGGNYARAVDILNWVVKAAPGRSVAHLNMADALAKLGKSEEAKKHYYIYQEQMRAFHPKAKIALSPAAAELVKTPPALSEGEKSQWLAFAELKEFDCLNFPGPTLFPVDADTKQDGKSFRFAKHFTVDRTFCLFGIPVDNKKDLKIEASAVEYAQLARDFTFPDGTRCVAGKQFKLEWKDKFTCTLAGDQTIRGLPLQGGSIVSFYLGDKSPPYFFTLTKDAVVHGYPLQAGSHQLKGPHNPYTAATISAPVKMGGIEFPAGTRFSFTDYDKEPETVADLGKHVLMDVTPGAPMRVQGILFDKWIQFARMDVQLGVLAEDWADVDRKCAKGNKLILRKLSPRENYCQP